MRKLSVVGILLVVIFFVVHAQEKPSLSPVTKSFATVDSPIVALDHIRIIDGTGAPAAPDQTLLIENGAIREIGKSGSIPIPSGARTLDLSGRTVIPGLVGMHDHLFYPSASGQTPVAGAPPLYGEMGFSFPRLYLAGGVTSVRTTGSLETYTDLALKKLIDSGKIPGPRLHITGPYLEGVGSFTPQLHELQSPEEATRLVNYWIDEGATSFKAYMHISRAELGAAIKAAHARGVKVTGHLCSVGFREAADLGIDDLEHGLAVDTEFTPGKKPDICPAAAPARDALVKLDEKGPEIQSLIRHLIEKHVAVTSTLPVFETFVPGRAPNDPRVLAAMLPEAQKEYLATRDRTAAAQNSVWPNLFAKELAFEHDFAKAGGLLLAGLDPTGYGGVIPGYGDQREVELLVEAGFTPLEAIRIATWNGAKFLGEESSLGSIAPGK